MVEMIDQENGTIFDTRGYEADIENEIENNPEFKKLIDQIIASLRKIICNKLIQSNTG